jgi:putative Mg2+ transporter-C (MgtC) family protein
MRLAHFARGRGRPRGGIKQLMTFLWGDWQETGRDAGRLLLAYLLALPVGWYREKEAHSVGVRTFPLTAVASCGYVLLASTPHMSADAQSRIIQGLVTGIGFIGGGAILKAEGSVHGTSTAASIWNTGALGAAVALGRFDVAIMLAALNLFALHVLRPMMDKIDAKRKAKEDLKA